MARIKFLIFALLGVGLAVAGLMSLSVRFAELSRVQTDERLAWGKVLLESSERLAQAHRAGALASVASDPSVVVALASIERVAPGAEGAGATALETVRKAATDALEKLPGGIGSAAFILVSNGTGAGAVDAGGENTRTLAEDQFGLGSAEASVDGHLALVDGALYRVSVAEVKGADSVTGAAKTVARIAAAFPLDSAWVTERAKDLTLGVTLVAGESVHSTLPESEQKLAASASKGPIALGSVQPLGPVVLPLFTNGAPLAQAEVIELAGIDGGRVVLTAEAATLASLAEFQRTALLGLAGLVALSLAFLLAIGSGAKAAAAEAAADEPAEAARPAEQVAHTAAFESAAAPAPAAQEAPAPEPAPVTPDDFPFGNEPQPQAHAADQAGGAAQLGADLFSMPAPEAPAAPAAPADDFLSSPPPAPEPVTGAPPAADLFAAAAASSPPGTATASAALDAVPLPPPPGTDPFGQVPSGGHQHEETTGSYRAMDPFALAAAQMDPSEKQQYNERTVVAAVPEQLLRATGKKTSPSAVALPAPTPAAPAVSSEDAHFVEVFQQFVATRAQCNEPADGLTQDKFVAKLRKNREQLIQKYNCKTVRFQVYVKDGKAALKATPIKEA